MNVFENIVTPHMIANSLDDWALAHVDLSHNEGSVGSDCTVVKP
jgi:hypothetical protein